MAKPELLQSFSILSKKVDLLLEKQNKLQSRIKFLENLNEELKRQHEIDVASIEKAQKEIEFLSLSYRLAASPEALVSARNKISKLIRTIDSCIRMINED